MPDALADLIADIKARVHEMGFELVDLRKGGTKNRARLQVRIDRPGATPGNGVTIGECATVSRQLEAWLDGTGTLGPRYVLEVSSPGIERPVRWSEHWARYTGHDVRVTLPERKRIRATIIHVDEVAATAVLRPHGADHDVTVALDEVRDAHLVVDWDAVQRHDM